jgi:hypothetical protein
MKKMDKNFVEIKLIFTFHKSFRTGKPLPKRRIRATPTVCQRALVSLFFFWQKEKKETPTVWQKGLAFLGSWQNPALRAHICALPTSAHPLRACCVHGCAAAPAAVYCCCVWQLLCTWCEEKWGDRGRQKDQTERTWPCFSALSAGHPRDLTERTWVLQCFVCWTYVNTAWEEVLTGWEESPPWTNREHDEGKETAVAFWRAHVKASHEKKLVGPIFDFAKWNTPNF